MEVVLIVRVEGVSIVAGKELLDGLLGEHCRGGVAEGAVVATFCGRLGIFLDVFGNSGIVVVVLGEDVGGEEGVEGVEASHVDALMWIWRSGRCGGRREEQQREGEGRSVVVSEGGSVEGLLNER